MKRSSRKRNSSRAKGIFELSKKINNIQTNIKVYKKGHLIHFEANTDEKVDFLSNFTINVNTNKFYTSVNHKNILIGGIELPTTKRSRHKSGGKKKKVSKQIINEILKFQLDEAKQQIEKRVDRSIEKLKLKNEHEIKKYSAWTVMFMITVLTLYYSGIVGKIFGTVDGVVDVARDLVKVANKGVEVVDKGVGVIETLGKLGTIVLMVGTIAKIAKLFIN